MRSIDPEDSAFFRKKGCTRAAGKWRHGVERFTIPLYKLSTRPIPNGGNTRSQKMNLYKISQRVNTNYDTFDSAIVRATSPATAKKIHPYGDRVWTAKGWKFENGTIDEFGRDDTWTDDLKSIKVELIGKSTNKQGNIILYSSDEKPGVVLASFNAG